MLNKGLIQVYVIYKPVEGASEVLEVWRSESNIDKLPEFYVKALLDVFSNDMLNQSDVDCTASNIEKWALVGIVKQVCWEGLAFNLKIYACVFEFFTLDFKLPIYITWDGEFDLLVFTVLMVKVQVLVLRLTFSEGAAVYINKNEYYSWSLSV